MPWGLPSWMKPTQVPQLIVFTIRRLSKQCLMLSASGFEFKNTDG